MWDVVSAYSVAIAAIIGLVRLNKIDKHDWIFIFLMWLGLANEIITDIMEKLGKTNILNTNIYSLFEAILIIQLFRNWGAFKKQRAVYLIFCIFILVWCLDAFVISGLNSYTSYFNILYSFIIVIVSINMINPLIIEERKALLTNATFLICIGFIIFFTYAVLVEIYWLYGKSPEFLDRIYNILSYVNLFVNLIYAFAILWISKKQKYILL